ncbi:hypothetical protein [Actinokineospora spheciospongiae]|uniref:hypothetical protein n=1 Tax=Actinokineospora spheciospongiae TaxID=909613 RepID=UPI001F42F568|nr:hypothetical protein [Actinokineospora spheciospongiae]
MAAGDMTAGIAPGTTREGAAPRTATGAATASRGLPTALALLTGSLLTLVGLTWDVQWHTDVGPDTFFTLPHLFLYAGSAVAGLASLGAVLAATAGQRAGRDPDPVVGGRPIAVLRVFSAPIGYLVAGCGAASFLLYGLWDQWWHGLYGFDAVIDSPPHIGLLLSVMATLVGTVMVFAAAYRQTWGRVGTVTSLGILAAFSTIVVLGFSNVGGPVDAVSAALSWLMVVLVVTAVGFARKPGLAVALAVALGIIQAVGWWFSPWATHVYADAVGLPIRDYIRGVPVMPALMPMGLVLVAALVEVFAVAARRGNRRLPAVAGALAGGLVAGFQGVQNAWVYGYAVPPVGDLAPTVVAGVVLGLLAGFVGWRFGRMLRLVDPGKA